MDLSNPFYFSSLIPNFTYFVTVPITPLLMDFVWGGGIVIKFCRHFFNHRSVHYKSGIVYLMFWHVCFVYFSSIRKQKKKKLVEALFDSQNIEIRMLNQSLMFGIHLPFVSVCLEISDLSVAYDSDIYSLATSNHSRQ